MLITKLDNILVKNLSKLKGYNTKQISQKVSQQRLDSRQHLQVVAKATGYCVGRPSSRQRQIMQRVHWW